MYSFIADVLTEDLSALQAGLLRHPLWQDISAGRATPAQLRTFALQDHWLVRHSLQLETLLIAHAPDEATRAVLLRKLEPKALFSGEGSLLHFGEALGMGQADFDAAEPLPGCAALTTHFYYSLAREGFLGLLASVAASESIFIALCDVAGPALRTHYGFTEEQVAFFPLHDRLKDGVNVGEAGLLRALASAPDARERVTRTLRRTYAFERLFYDTVYATG